jgi:hypothetical protein
MLNMALVGALDVRWMMALRALVGILSMSPSVLPFTGTLMAFQPQYPHGTTQLAGAHNRTCAITFSEHIFKAYEKARVAEGLTTIESGSGL